MLTQGELRRDIDSRNNSVKRDEADLEQRMGVCLSPTVRPGEKGGSPSIFH